jgi:hypothetical protein
MSLDPVQVSPAKIHYHRQPLTRSPRSRSPAKYSEDSRLTQQRFFVAMVENTHPLMIIALAVLTTLLINSHAFQAAFTPVATGQWLWYIPFQSVRSVAVYVLFACSIAAALFKLLASLFGTGAAYFVLGAKWGAYGVGAVALVVVGLWLRWPGVRLSMTSRERVLRGVKRCSTLRCERRGNWRMASRLVRRRGWIVSSTPPRTILSRRQCCQEGLLVDGSI